MKKVLYSLIIVLCVAIFTIGSTLAFFVDRESSEANLWQAGAIDLKVDSEAHFRELVCVDGFWSETDIIDCDDRESTDDFRSFTYNIDDVYEVKCAPVKKNCIDFGFDFTIAKWNIVDGVYVIEGDENGTEVIGDDELANWISENEVAGVIRKAATNYTILPGGYSGVVDEYCLNKTKCYGISHIEFCGNETDECGNCILEDGEECDNSLNVPEGYSCTEECIIVPKDPCVGTWEETDLVEEEHKFFSFENLKPGDYGEDTISLHVYDNDAWGRLLIENVDSQENSCTPPEYFDEEDCDDDKEGELLEKTYFYAWLDEGEVPGFQNTHLNEDDPDFDVTEGDNVKQINEILFRDTAVLDEEGEEWRLKPVLTESYEANCTSYEMNGHNEHGACHGLAVDGRFVGDTVYYIGLAWEFPQLGGNSTQSDSFSFDMVFEVEQWRHND